eukprot:2054024-Alexandrium_andersonii.AAC.1
MVPQERSDMVPGGDPASSNTEVQQVKKSHKKKKEPLSGGRTAKQKAEQGSKLYVRKPDDRMLDTEKLDA